VPIADNHVEVYHAISLHDQKVELGKKSSILSHLLNSMGRARVSLSNSRPMGEGFAR